MAEPKSPSATLFERLGGYDAIAGLIEDLYGRMLEDPQIGDFWKGHSTDSRVRELRSFVDFVCQAAGGPAIYRGRDMHTSHQGLVINESDWIVFSELAVAVLEERELPGAEKEEVLSLFEGFREVLGINDRPMRGRDSVSIYPHGLSRREEEVLRLVAAGKNNPEIARRLSISLNTVTRHLTHIFSKTATANRVEAAIFAARHGLS